MKITKLFEGENITAPRFRAKTIEGNTIEVSSIVFMMDGSYIVNEEFPICNEKLFICIGNVDIPIAPVQRLMETDKNLSLLDAINIATKKLCGKCGNKISRPTPTVCPTDGILYCEKCLNPQPHQR